MPPLELIVGSLDAIDEPQRTLYIQRDGKYHLDVNLPSPPPPPDTSRLTRALEAERKARADAEAKLKPFWVVALRVLFAPPFYFLKAYIGRNMWSLGLYGYAIAGMHAHGRWLRDIKMLEIHLRRRHEKHG